MLSNVFHNLPMFDYQKETPEEVIAFSLLPLPLALQADFGVQAKVPKLLTHRRNLNLTGSAIVSSKAEFSQRFNDLCQGVFNGLDYSNVFIAGGAILGSCASERAGTPLSRRLPPAPSLVSPNRLICSFGASVFGYRYLPLRSSKRIRGQRKVEAHLSDRRSEYRGQR